MTANSITLTIQHHDAIRALLTSKGYTAPAIAIIVIDDGDELIIRDSSEMLIGTISKNKNLQDHDTAA